MEIYLIRHTRVAVDGSICYGISDVELAHSQIEDMLVVKNKLSGINLTKVYSSPLKRCRQLANSIAEKITLADELVEMDFGQWEMKKWDELDRTELDIWMDDFVHQRPSTGECYTDFAMKSVMFFDHLVKLSADHDKVALFTHSGPIRSIVCHVLNLALHHSFNFEIDYGSVTKIEVSEGWYKIKYLNG